jgi:hypothetical protein
MNDLAKNRPWQLTPTDPFSFAPLSLLGELLKHMQVVHSTSLARREKITTYFKFSLWCQDGKRQGHVLMCVEHVPTVFNLFLSRAMVGGVGMAMIALLICARFLRPKLASEPRAWPCDSSYNISTN